MPLSPSSAWVIKGRTDNDPSKQHTKAVRISLSDGAIMIIKTKPSETTIDGRYEKWE